MLLLPAQIAAGQAAADLDYDEQLVVTGESEPVVGPADGDSRANPPATEEVAVAIPQRIIGQLGEFAGVEVNSLGPGQRQSLTLRGSSAQQVLLLYNGVPLNSALGGGADLSLYMLDQVSTLAVSRGTAAAYGDGAMGGAVELFGTNLLDKKLSSRALVELNGGSLGSWGLTGSGRYLWDRGGAQFSLGARRSSGEFDYVDDNGVRRHRTNNDSRQLGTTFTMAQRLKGQDYLTLLAHVTAGQRGVAGPYQMESFSARQSDVKSLLGLHLSFFPRWKMAPEFTLDGIMRYERLHFSDPHPPYDAPFDELDNVLHYFVAFSGSFSPVSSQRPGLALKLGGQQLYQNGTGINRPEYQVTLFDHMDFLKEHLLVDISLAFAGNGAMFLFLPQLDSRYRFVYNKKSIREFSLFVTAGRGGRFPSFYELYMRHDGIQPNPKLSQESSWEISGGLRLEQKYFQLSAGGFHRWQKDSILFVPVTASIIQAQNFSSSRAYGLEAEFFGKWYLSWRLSYTLTRTRFGKQGQLELPGHPRHRGVIKLSYDITVYEGRKRVGKIILTPWAKSMLQSSMVLDRFNNITEEGRVLVNIGLDAKLPWTLHCSFWVENLLDKRDAVDAMQYPLSGRTFWFVIGGGWESLQ